MPSGLSVQRARAPGQAAFVRCKLRLGRRLTAAEAPPANQLGINNPAAQTNITLVKHRRLPRRHRPLRSR